MTRERGYLAILAVIALVAACLICGCRKDTPPAEKTGEEKQKPDTHKDEVTWPVNLLLVEDDGRVILLTVGEKEGDVTRRQLFDDTRTWASFQCKPNGNYLYWSESDKWFRGNIWLPEEQEEIRWESESGQPAWPTMSPDGRKRILTEDHRKAKTTTLIIRDLVSGRPLHSFTRKGLILSPAWSPEGRRIAYHAYAQMRIGDDNCSLRMLQITDDGLIDSELARPTMRLDRYSTPANIWSMPSWSPDGRKILYMAKFHNAGKGEEWRIYSADTGKTSIVDHWGFWMADSRHLYVSVFKEKVEGVTTYSHFTWDVLNNTVAEQGADFLYSRDTKCALEPFGSTMAYVTPEDGLRIIDIYGKVLKSVPDIKPPKRLLWVSNPQDR